MSRYKLLRLTKFSTFLLPIALWASPAPIDHLDLHHNVTQRDALA